MQTKLGDWVVETFDIEENPVDTKIKDITHTKTKPNYIKSKNFKAGLLGELTARALTRTKIHLIV